MIRSAPAFALLLLVPVTGAAAFAPDGSILWPGKLNQDRLSQLDRNVPLFSHHDSMDTTDAVDFSRSDLTEFGTPFNSNSHNRRTMLSTLFQAATLLGCSCAMPHTAYGLAQITPPPTEALTAYDLPRNPLQDAMFAQGMSMGMVDYEKEAYPVKKRLFQQMFATLPKTSNEPVIVEVGMGSFPNALFYKQQKGLDIIGIDPNDRMEGYARDNAQKAKLKANNLRIIHGVSEALPLKDNSCDAVVCTLTLCSVLDPATSLAEIRRVLKPGGQFLFWEHVLSETNDRLAQRQILETPTQVKRADGCHLDRRTGDTIRAAGFSNLNLEYLELTNFGFLNPTVCGIATA